MKRFIFIAFLFLTMFSSCQVPSVGGMQKPGVVESGDGSWDISGLTYVRSQDVYSYESNVTDVFFNPDGTKMYTVGFGGDEVNEFSLSTAWDISSLSHVGYKSIISYESVVHGLWIDPDGTKLHIAGSGGDEVNEFSLSPAWDVSSLSFDRLLSMSSYGAYTQSIFFTSDGTKMYVSDSNAENLIQFSLSTGFNISTTTHVRTVDVNSTEFPSITIDAINDYHFNPDGTKLYAIDLTTPPEMFEFSLSTEWDISTLSYVETFNIDTYVTGANGMYISPDGNNLYIADRGSDDIHQYTITK